MTELKKGTSSVDPKEKGSLLVEADDGIGKEFLSSWKSTSMMEDVALDFGLETVPKGNKKAFDFGKFDMDFNLDGDFGNLSSFKVDMPDLDFSSPSKSTAKKRERSKEESSRNYQGKQNRFTLFDFNESDDFSFDSNMVMNGEKISKKNLDEKGVASDKNEDEGLKILCHEADDRMITKPAASEGIAHSEIETMVGGPAILASSSPENRMTLLFEETNQESSPTEMAAYTESCAVEGRNKFPFQSIYEKESNQDAVSDMNTDLSSHVTEGNVDVGVRQNVDTNVIVEELNHENWQPENSSPLCIIGSEKIMSDQEKSGNNTVKEPLNETVPTHGDVDPEDALTEAVSRNAQEDVSANQDTQSLTSDLPFVPLGSEGVYNNLTAKKENKAGVIRLTCFSGAEKTGPMLCPSSLSQPEFSSLGGNDSSNSRLANEKRPNDSQLGRKLVDGNSDPLLKQLTEKDPVFLGAKQMINVSNSRVSFSPDGIRNGPKLAGYSTQQDKEASKGKAFMLGSENDAGSQPSYSSPSEKTTKFAVSGMESVGNPKVSSVDKLKTVKRMADLSSLKNLRIPGGKNVPSSSIPHQEITSLGKLEQNMELQGNTFSKISYSICGTKTQTLPTPSLKRKNIKESNANLASLKLIKRLSGPRSESRNVAESSEIFVEEKENCKEIKTNYRSTSMLEATLEVSLTKLEMPLVLQNNSNVERAETYAKELEDIANMLKKKHEEAREILVRAIVNSNNLLMLDHPIYEDKISKLQKFAAQLVSKELPVKSLGSTVV